jgi:hypothetical protein
MFQAQSQVNRSCLPVSQLLYVVLWSARSRNNSPSCDRVRKILSERLQANVPLLQRTYQKRFRLLTAARGALLRTLDNSWFTCLHCPAAGSQEDSTQSHEDTSQAHSAPQHSNVTKSSNSAVVRTSASRRLTPRATVALGTLKVHT